MAKKEQKIEYGLKAAPIGVGEGTISKEQFFQSLEAEYPSAEGWEVWHTDVTPATDSRYLVVYHLKRVNG